MFVRLSNQQKTKHDMNNYSQQGWKLISVLQMRIIASDSLWSICIYKIQGSFQNIAQRTNLINFILHNLGQKLTLYVICLQRSRKRLSDNPVYQSTFKEDFLEKKKKMQRTIMRSSLNKEYYGGTCIPNISSDVSFIPMY
jgi:hypothetical protein